MLHQMNIASVTEYADFAPAETIELPVTKPQPEHSGLEIPSAIWKAMFASYAVFFAGLGFATGHSAGAIFMLTISIGYVVMYFGTASLLFNMNAPERPGLFQKGIGPLQTNTGSMSYGAVAAQILTIPFCLALFGVAMVAFRALLF
ncbi:hypothetical protein ACFOWX_04335 [Sphingorhabdus arenilitoris]|uniref:Uncharacterized protein n=1 Tax=Sphingorhabdus arenilitoris TaxID=1490041 RepID=A0ABV8REE7_9SPHN